MKYVIFWGQLKKYFNMLKYFFIMEPLKVYDKTHQKQQNYQCSDIDLSVFTSQVYFNYMEMKKTLSLISLSLRNTENDGCFVISRHFPWTLRTYNNIYFSSVIVYKREWQRRLKGIQSSVWISI